MKNSLWKRPPIYRGAKDNKRTVKGFSEMAFGLSALASQAAPETEKELERIGLTLELQAETLSKTADIGTISFSVYEDFQALSGSLLGDGHSEEILFILKALQTDISIMKNLLAHDIKSSPLQLKVNRQVKKFIRNMSDVQVIYRAAANDLQVAKRKNRSAGYINGRTKAVEALSSIVASLDEIAETAKISPSLSKRVNRLVKPKRLADFFGKPLKSQKAREDLKKELYYIIANELQAYESEAEWNDVLASTVDITENMPQTEMGNVKMVGEPIQDEIKTKNTNITGEQNYE